MFRLALSSHLCFDFRDGNRDTLSPNTVLMSPKKDETAVHRCDPALSVLIMFGVSKRLSRSISLAVY